MPQRTFTCSTCGREFSPDNAAAHPLLCPHCGAIYIVDDATGNFPHQSNIQIQYFGPDADQRIRQIIRLRRSIIRTRGWCITAAIACLVLAVQQIIWPIAALANAQWNPQQTSRLLFAIILLAAAVFLSRRIVRLSSELRRRSLTDPTTPPDFSSLSDGSQHARDLEKLNDDELK